MQTRQSTEFRIQPSSARPVPECGAPPQEGPDLVTVPARQGLEAVDILRRGAADCVGPVLHDDGCDTLGFLVPPGTADAWDLPGSTCTQTQGRGMSLVAPEPPLEGTGWLLPPGDAEAATDPAVLRKALGEAARLIEAADNCQ
ncbi:hypothetical protein [Streptomyces sp. NPDC001020]